MRIGRRGVVDLGRAYWIVAVPVIVRMDGAQEGVRAGGQRGDVVDPGLDAREDLADEGGRAGRVLELDVVGRRGSLLSKTIVNGGRPAP